jgi:hypothetical protein
MPFLGWKRVTNDASGPCSSPSVPNGAVSCALLYTLRNYFNLRLAHTWPWRSFDGAHHAMSPWPRQPRQRRMQHGCSQDPHHSLVTSNPSHGQQQGAFRLVQGRCVLFWLPDSRPCVRAVPWPGRWFPTPLACCAGSSFGSEMLQGAPMSAPDMFAEFYIHGCNMRRVLCHSYLDSPFHGCVLKDFLDTS